MCKKLRLIKTCAFYNFRLWRGNARIVTVFVLALILCFLLTDQVIGLVKEQGTTIQIAESFIWTFGDSSSILLSSLLLLLLFADMPFVTNATPLFLVRCSRKIWVLGQLLYIGLYLRAMCALFFCQEYLEQDSFYSSLLCGIRGRVAGIFKGNGDDQPL